MMSDYKVEMVNDGMSEFYVEFHGPQESKWISVFKSSLACMFLPLCVWNEGQVQFGLLVFYGQE